MKILVIGGSGRIGFNVSKFLSQKHLVFPTFCSHDLTNIFPTAKKLDATNLDETLDLFNSINPDIVIHSAALANIDLCETNHELADLLNIKVTENIIKASESSNSKIIYFSTSYVFNGKENIYVETDETSPTTYYGYTKHVGENKIKNYKLDWLILRTDQPYGWIEKWQKDNSVTRVLNNFSKSASVRDVVDWLNNPTLVDDLSNIISILLDKKKTGIYHAVGSDFINRFEWAKITAEIFNLNKEKIISIQSKDLDLSAVRVNVNLSNKKIIQDTGYNMKGIREGLLYMYNTRI